MLLGWWLVVNISHFVERDHCLILRGSGQEETLVNAPTLHKGKSLVSENRLFRTVLCYKGLNDSCVMTQLRYMDVMKRPNKRKCSLLVFLYYVLLSFYFILCAPVQFVAAMI